MVIKKLKDKLKVNESDLEQYRRDLEYFQNNQNNSKVEEFNIEINKEEDGKIRVTEYNNSDDESRPIKYTNVFDGNTTTYSKGLSGTSYNFNQNKFKITRNN